jgi:mannose-6-phosphate isomerase-like protein (cupin superfamily)
MNVPRGAVNALPFLALLALACSGSRRPTVGQPPPTPAAQPAAGLTTPDRTGPHGGRFVAPSAGTALVFCTAPGLAATVKLDSAAVGLTTFAMGTAAVAVGGSNTGSHAADDEAVYFLRGEGRAFVGPDTTEVRPGLVMYVPRGVRHGFISTGTTPLEFLWTIAPGRLAAAFRARGVAPGTPCPPAPAR